MTDDAMKSEQNAKVSEDFNWFCNNFYKDLYKALGEKYRVKLTTLRENPLAVDRYKGEIPVVTVQSGSDSPHVICMLTAFSSYYGKESYSDALERISKEIESSLAFYNSTL